MSDTIASIVSATDPRLTATTRSDHPHRGDPASEIPVAPTTHRVRIRPQRSRCRTNRPTSANANSALAGPSSNAPGAPNITRSADDTSITETTPDQTRRRYFKDGQVVALLPRSTAHMNGAVGYGLPIVAGRRVM